MERTAAKTSPSMFDDKSANSFPIFAATTGESALPMLHLPNDPCQMSGKERMGKRDPGATRQ
jgi:hypothetical protein